MQEQPDNEDRSQHPSRGQYTTEEWMLICQHNIDVQPVSDPQENYDWTISSQSYSNLGEVPSFISSRRGSTIQSTATHNVDARLLLGKQLHVYNIVYQHFHSNNPNQLKLIVSGTAGTGKSYLINCLKVLLHSKLRVCAPTGVASFNIQGYTLHSLFNLPIRGDFKDLQGEKLNDIQQSFSEVDYIIIDEMSMVGRKLFAQVDRRLRQIFPHRAQEVLGGCSCILFGDFGQLPPVMDLSLYTTVSRGELSDQGSATYHSFDQAIVLDKIMRQSGQSADQVLFRDILLRLRDGTTTVADWEELMQQTPSKADDMSLFLSAVHLFPTVESVAEYNITQLRAINKPIALIKAVHTGNNASKASSDDA